MVATSSSATVPASWHSGDCLIVICSTPYTGSSNAWNTPSGYTLLNGNAFGTSKSPLTAVFWKIGSGADLGSTVTCSYTSSSTSGVATIILGITYWDSSINVCVTDLSPLWTIASGSSPFTKTTGAGTVTGRAGATNISFWGSSGLYGSPNYSGETNANFGAMTQYHTDSPNNGQSDIALVLQPTASTLGTSTVTYTTPSTAMDGGGIALLINPPPPTPTPTVVPHSYSTFSD